MQKRQHNIQLHLARLQYEKLAAIGTSLSLSSLAHAENPTEVMVDSECSVKQLHVHNHKLAAGQRFHPRKGERRFLVRLEPPAWAWFLNRALEICACQSHAGSLFAFRAYNLIPPEAKILECVREGNVNGVQKLLSDRKTSPFDRTPAGFTLLDVSDLSNIAGPDNCRSMY